MLLLCAAIAYLDSMTPLLDNRTISVKAQLIQHPALPVPQSQSCSKNAGWTKSVTASGHQPMSSEMLLSASA